MRGVESGCGECDLLGVLWRFEGACFDLFKYNWRCGICMIS